MGTSVIPVMHLHLRGWEGNRRMYPSIFPLKVKMTFVVGSRSGHMVCYPVCEYPVSWTKQTMERQAWQACDILYSSSVASHHEKQEQRQRGRF